MTVYVIDAAHPLPATYRDGEHALRIGGGDTVLLSAGLSVAAFGLNADGIYSSGRTTLFLNGEVSSAHGAAIGAAEASIHIGATGSLSGADGISFLERSPGSSANNVVSNAGIVHASQHGVGIFFRSGTNVVVNTGEISGGGGIWHLGEATADRVEVYNTGVIRATTGGSFEGAINGTNIVVNGGRMEGNVFLGFGDDVYDGRGGTIAGLIYLLGGHDVVYGGDGSEQVRVSGGDHVIDGGGGIDRLLLNAITDGPLTVDLRITQRQQISGTSFGTFLNVEEIAGGVGHDQLTGNSADNQLLGWSGNDMLNGEAGDDRLEGWLGDDTLSGGSGTDVAVFSGNFADYAIARQSDGRVRIVSDSEGTDILTGIEYLQFADRTIALSQPANRAPVSVALTSTIVDGDATVGTVVATLSGVDPDGDALGYSLVSNPGGHFRIHGDKLLVDRTFTDRDADIAITVRASDPSGAAIDRTFLIDVAADTVSIPEGEVPGPVVDLPIQPLASLALKGGKRADVLVGGNGNDYLNGGLGKDKLTGGAGQDVFAFTTKLAAANVDRVLDFESQDTLVLSAKVFRVLAKGALAAGAFRLGAAKDADDRILYNSKTGVLSYDADGSGTEHAAVAFAKLAPKTALSAHDFLIVA